MGCLISLNGKKKNKNMENLYMYMAAMVYSIFLIYVGFKVALLRWNHKENAQKLENYETINNEITKANQKYIEMLEKVNETGKVNKNWYITQVKNISYYLKEKYDDTKLEEELFDVFNNPETKEIDIDDKKTYNINILLDKISKSGIDSLTEEELKFLNNNNKGDEDKK